MSPGADSDRVSDCGPCTGTLDPMSSAATPTEGLAVLHLFCRSTSTSDRHRLETAVGKAESDGLGVIPVAVLGHKADLALMIIAPELWQLRRLQSEVAAAGYEVVDSYVSLTEISEYAQARPDEYKQAKLYPELPPAGLTNWCFYPMSRAREVGANWYTLDFEERKRLMAEHGGSGRAFRGRVLQLITGSSGLDDYEWGVTLFAKHPDDLKDVVYTMRYDRASAEFAIFGRFYVGTIGTLDEVLDAVSPA